MPNLQLAAIGNCQIASLIDDRARMVWTCLPRLDGDPVFCSLLQEEEDPAAGFFDVELSGAVSSTQRYRLNTPILETVLTDDQGAQVEIVDFAPRFPLYGRTFRPAMLIRQLRPLTGRPRIRLRLRPVGRYGAVRPDTTQGSNHIRFLLPEQVLRVTTDGSTSALLEERAFVLDQPVTLVLGPDEPVTEAPGDLGRRFLELTTEYWQRWTRGLTIPLEWQDAVIRAAITLKLCTFEDTGAVVAAMTTSIPEAPGTVRTWDYRYCWLRDAYFVVQAMNRLGATKTMESYLRFLMDLAARSGDNHLQPVYGITGSARLEEIHVDTLPGYRGMGPVRVGNQAHEQVQNDVYGSVVLASMQSFFDQRLVHSGGIDAFRALEPLGEQALLRYDQPDAGPWEYRGRARVHTFSAVMCWAACDRLARIARVLGLDDPAARWRSHADRLHAEIAREAWNPGLGAFAESFGGDSLDASLLLLSDLRFLSPDDPRFRGTVQAIEKDLRRGDYLFRYSADDDFGAPETAFTVCTFWFIGALVATGRRDEARELFEHLLARRNRLGLLSEDIDPITHELWGNFPQTYSMVGIINSAMLLSRPWEDAI
ncbi:MAG: glycoside hydrolase family 15 protein [Gemmatimonadota bacterium]|nr:glycoside hydrolase family 15 protein [Gemmatimonadota bacterium]